MEEQAQARAQDTDALALPVERAWESIPFTNEFRNRLRPGSAVRTFAILTLIPLVIALFYGSLPRPAQRLMGEVTAIVSISAALGGVAFLACLFLYRVIRQLQQLRFNAALGAQLPNHFVLYLRSFRQTGAVVVRNHLDDLAERRLLGDYWDVELALSLIVMDKLSIVAIGAKRTSLGAAKLSSDDASWQELVVSVANKADAIWIVPDDRPSTLWELRQVLSNPALRRKTIVVMPPEQHGWRRRLLRLPSAAVIWERVCQQLQPEIALPPYRAGGAFLLFEKSSSTIDTIDLADFDPGRVRIILASRVLPLPIPADELKCLPSSSDEGPWWYAFVDPIWPIVFVTTGIAAVALETGSGTFQVVITSWFLASVASYLWYTSAYALQGLEKKGSLLARLFMTRVLRRSPPEVREAARSLLIIGTVFVLRSFVSEPFKIPSSSMRPTLEVGDFILVNKFTYGLRLPILEHTIVPISEPERGDLVVFRYPVNPSQDFIKRIVGIGGDELVYHDKRVSVNGQEWPLTAAGEYSYLEGLRFENTQRFSEALPEIAVQPHYIAINPNAAPVFPANVRPYPAREQCDYNEHGFTCRIPAGHYFVMGDNRDNSDDSRYWGFVPADYMRGKAYFIWFNWDDITSLAFARLGRIH